MSFYPEIIGKEAVCAAVKVKEGRIPSANGWLFLCFYLSYLKKSLHFCSMLTESMLRDVFSPTTVVRIYLELPTGKGG